MDPKYPLWPLAPRTAESTADVKKKKVQSTENNNCNNIGKINVAYFLRLTRSRANVGPLNNIPMIDRKLAQYPLEVPCN